MASNTASDESKLKILLETVMWGSFEDVQETLNSQGLILDDRYTDYAMLVLSLKRGRKEVAQMLLEKGCRVHKEQRNNNADTPLHYAVKLGDLDLVNTILLKEAPISEVDQNGDTPLIVAFKKEHDEIVDLILSKVSPNMVNTVNKDGLSHFHIACIRNNTDLVTSFLQKSVDINEQVKSNAKEWPGFTSLHFAVQFKCTEVLTLLLSHNADITKKNAKGLTALHLAVEEQNDSAIDLILKQHEKIWKNPVDTNELSHFHIACMKNQMKAVENFVKHGVNVNQSVKLTSPKWAGYTPLHFAVKGVSVNGKSQKVMIDFLLRNKADPNARDALNETPLHIACLLADDNNKFSRHMNHSSASDTESNKPVQCEKFFRIIDQIELVRIVDLLLHWDCNGNSKNEFNETSGFYLCQGLSSKFHCKSNNEVFIIVLRKFNRLRVDVMKFLIHHGLEVNSKNFSGCMLLHIISDLENVRENIKIATEMLIGKGSNINDQIRNGSISSQVTLKNESGIKINFVRSSADIKSDESLSVTSGTPYKQLEDANVSLQNRVNGNAKINKNQFYLSALKNEQKSKPKVNANNEKHQVQIKNDNHRCAGLPIKKKIHLIHSGVEEKSKNFVEYGTIDQPENLLKIMFAIKIKKDDIGSQLTFKYSENSESSSLHQKLDDGLKICKSPQPFNERLTMMQENHNKELKPHAPFKSTLQLSPKMFYHLANMDLKNLVQNLEAQCRRLLIEIYPQCLKMLRSWNFFSKWVAY